jgi:mannose-6-phosphate isomerase-like protein (cupin superfamily)
LKVDNLKKMNKGWFVGDFVPSIIRTKDFEVAVKNYSAGDVEDIHVHKIAQEVTVVVKGSIQMNDKAYFEGDIILIEPGEFTKFKSITDSTTVVVKTPSIVGDKYIDNS